MRLPGLQEDLLKAVVKTGTRTILVNMTGSAMDLTWAHDHVAAIVQGWYPGAEGGIALAELLFGEVDFSARTPVTWVKHTEDLPDFLDYSMKNRTYRYIESEPMYPFGYGLSYNEYTYSNLTLSSTEIKVGEALKVTVDVTNQGDRTGREVVQLYLTDVEASVDVPWHSLVNFENVCLEAGETRTLTFEVEASQMAVVNEEGEKVLEPGNFVIHAGGQGPDRRSKELTGKEVLSAEFTMS